MDSNPLKNINWKPSPSGAGVSPALWVVIGALGLVALGMAAFNFGKVFREPSSAAAPTQIPRSSSTEIEINSTLTLSAESGSFIIWGDPVNQDVICSRGQVFDLEYYDLSPDPETLTDLQIHKRFECEDGSGSFEMDLDVDISGNNTTGTWTITGGSGRYSGLTGSGTVQGTYLTEDLVADSYVGNVNN